MEDLRKAKLEEILLNAPNMKCDCGCTIFEPCTVIKEISELVSPSGQKETVPIEVYVCKKCGKVLSAMFKSGDNCRRTIGPDVPMTLHPNSDSSNNHKSNLIV